MDLINKIVDYVAVGAMLASVALAIFVIFWIGIIFFTVIGFVLVWLSGMAAGFYLASRLYISCTKIED